MWVFTKHGYFSVIKFDITKTRGALGDDLRYEVSMFYDKSDWEDLLLIRTRSLEDARRMAQWCQKEWKWNPSIFSTHRFEYSDYPFRMVMLKSEWERYLAAQVEDLDYTNFKDMVTKELGPERHDTYLRVWGVLHELTEGSRYSERPKYDPDFKTSQLPGMEDTNE